MRWPQKPCAIKFNLLVLVLNHWHVKCHKTFNTINIFHEVAVFSEFCDATERLCECRNVLIQQCKVK